MRMAFLAVALLAGGCVSSIDPLPDAVHPSAIEAERRGASPPDPDGLRAAVVESWLARLRERPSAAGRPLCVSAVEQAETLPLLPPPRPPFALEEPGRQYTVVDGRVVEEDGCAVLFMGPEPIRLTIGPVSHWWDDRARYDVNVAVDGLAEGCLVIVELYGHDARYANGRWTVGAAEPRAPFSVPGQVWVPGNIEPRPAEVGGASN